MLLVLADHPHHTAAMDDLALVTNLLDRRTYLHNHNPSISLLISPDAPAGHTHDNEPPERLVAFWRQTGALLVSVNDAATVQIVWTQLHRNTISREDADEILPHTSGYVGQHLMLVLEFYFEHRVWQRLENRRHNFNCVFLRQSIFLVLPDSSRQTVLAKPPATYVPTPMIPDFQALGAKLLQLSASETSLIATLYVKEKPHILLLNQAAGGNFALTASKSPRHPW
jgi:hypothetical protein